MKRALIFFISVLKYSETIQLILLLGDRFNEAKLAFFDLKYENQNTHVGYERDQRFSGLKPQNA